MKPVFTGSVLVPYALQKRVGRGAASRPSWHSGELLLLILVHPDFPGEGDGIISKQVLLPVCFSEPKCP